MARIDTNPETILDRVVKRLIAQLDDATESTCWQSLDPETVPSVAPGDFWYVVSPGVTGRFDQGLFDGGAVNQATVDWSFAVTIWSTLNLDEVGHDTQFLGKKSLGILPRARHVLKALSGHDLADHDENQILAQPIFPADFSLARDPEKSRGSIQLAFNCLFDWDLTD